MKKLAVCFYFCCAIVSIPSLSFASSEVDCSSTCPSGERLVSFNDGTIVSCSCVIEADMIEQESQNRDVNEDDLLNQSELDAQANS